MILSIGVLLLSSAALPKAPAVARNDARLIEILSDARRNEGTAFQRLCKLGPMSTGAIMDMLSTRVIHQDPQNAGPLLTDATRALIFDAARTWPSKTVMRELNEWMTTESTLVDRIAAIEFAETAARASDLRSVSYLLDGILEQDLQHSFVQNALERTFRAALQRDPEGITRLAGDLDDLRQGMLPALILAIAETGGIEGAQLLKRIVERHPHLTEKTLNALKDWPVHTGITATEACLAIAARSLVDPNVKTQSAALVAIGRLQGTSLFGEVLDYLDSDEARIRQGALWTLQQLSGLRWGDDIERWIDFYDAELEWLNSNGRRLMNAIEDGGPDALEALRLVAEHRLWRHELTRAVASLARSEEQHVCSASIATLARLDSYTAIEPLIETLDNPNEPIRLAAHSTLRLMTRQTLGPQADAWREWLLQ